MVSKLLGETNYDVKDKFTKSKQSTLLFNLDVAKDNDEREKIINVVKDTDKEFKAAIVTSMKSEEVSKEITDLEVVVFAEDGLYKRDNGIWTVQDTNGQGWKELARSNLNSAKTHIESDEGEKLPEVDPKDSDYLGKTKKVFADLWSGTKKETRKGIDYIDKTVKGSNKSSVVENFKDSGFGIIVGGEETDASLFAGCTDHENLVTVSIENKNLGADYYVNDLDEILRFLKKL